MAGLDSKEELLADLREAGHEIVDFGAHTLNPADDYPDFVIPLARAVAAGTVQRGVAICGSGVGASVCVNKVPGVRAGLVHDHFSARPGVEDDNMKIICMGGRTIGPCSAWDLLEAFPAAQFSGAERHRRRLAKVASLEMESTGKKASTPPLRAAPHDSGPMWVATSHSCDFCIHYTSPV
jgi:ribose 5-phosphate isomerase B